jgi:hypothetical protein
MLAAWAQFIPVRLHLGQLVLHVGEDLTLQIYSLAEL